MDIEVASSPASPPMARWAEVVEHLDSYVSAPTAQQVALAKKLEIELASDTPAPVAREILRERLALPLGLPGTDRSADEASVQYLHTLEQELGLEATADEELSSQDLTRAWIEVRYSQRASRFLKELQPEIDDVVMASSPSKTLEGEINSIGLDGQLHLKGGMGRRARPHQVKIVDRKGSESHSATAHRVRQNVALLRSDIDNGYARMEELAQWRVDQTISEVAIAALEDALDTAEHEDVLQHVLERFPSLLGHLIVGNHGAFVIPQKSLGGTFRPDFLVGGVTSQGFRWLLVELESPSAALTIQDGQGTHQVRKGVNQVREWREWLTENLDYARKPVTSLGMGLPGIRANSEGLVIVSRQNDSSAANVMRAF